MSIAVISPFSVPVNFVILLMKDLTVSSAMEDEEVEAMSEYRPLLTTSGSAASIMGTVKLTENGIIYIPAATADPRGKITRTTCWQ